MTEIAATKKNKVWHIYRFKERYELPDDKKILRKSGLLFTRDFVGTGAGDEAVGYANQFAMLCNGDGLDTALMNGLYRLLVKMAASHSYYRRGYLLGPDGSALTAAELGAMLNIPGRKMFSLLNRFKRVQLLEYVTLPDFDELENPSDTGSGSGRKKGKKTTRKKAKKRSLRKFPEISGNFRKPLNKTETTNGCAYKGNKRQDGSSSLQEKKTATVDPGYAQEGQEAAGKPSKPSKPHEAASSGDRGHIIPIYDAGAAISPQYDRHDYRFGERIYQALGFTMPIEQLEAIREIASFASKWRQAQRRMSAFSPGQVDRVGMRLLQEARKIAKRPQNKNRGAVFCSVVDLIVDARLRERTA